MNYKNLVSVIDGVVYWKERPVKSKYDIMWNTRFAGKEAGCERPDGYRCVRFGKKLILTHRLVWTIEFGDIPDGMDIDHIDGFRLNNKIDNLRVVSRSDNLKNKAKSRFNKSGVTGVVFDKERGKWMAQIGGKGFHKNLGRFESFDEAVSARLLAEDELGYSKTHGRRNNEFVKVKI